jgi:jumonji domain-containing protein 2
MVKEVLECPVFHPTLEDLNGPFELYIEKIEKRIAKAGIAKIVAPAGWTPRRGGYDDVDVRIERCIKQVATGSRGLYRFLLVEQKPMMSKTDFAPLALAAENQPGTSEPAEIERKYWKNVPLRAPLYGADVDGSLFDDKAKVAMPTHLNMI